MLKLRKMESQDREQMLDILTDDTAKQTYILPDFESREDAVPLFLRLTAMSEDPLLYVRAIELDGMMIGFLNHVEIQDDTIELGYVIHCRFRHKGCMTQALRLAIDELFTLGYREVITGAFSCNTASIRVMEKCRMERLPRLESIDYRGQTHSCVYYAIRSQEEPEC